MALIRLIALLLVAATASAAQAQVVAQTVTFPTFDRSFKGVLTGMLYRPDGDGPFRAMVLLHTCGGIQGYIEDWAQWFAGNGYEALVVDSFGPRGVTSVCGVPDGQPDERTRAYDAYGALAYLRTRSEVDGGRIGMIGWSHGAGTVLAADDAGFAAGLVKGTGFRAAIALYPPCEFMPRHDVAAPLLLLLAADDDWTPPRACERAAGSLAQGGYPVSDYIYTGTTHAFDNPADRGVTHVRQHVYTLIYNANSANDAHARVGAYLTGVMR